MEDLTGKQFGQYQIVEPLGEGGMAAVYKAYQPSMERFVAIKVLPRQMATSEEFLARFRNEAKLLAQLQHPHILPVFDYGESDGYTYIVMTYIKSGTLADLIKKRRFSLKEIREILTQVGGALGYAHSRGMIHRDIKPSNVLVDETGHCLLTDFGLARMIESSSNLTSSGAVMGTPSYMSPEQGAGTRIDKRSDLYSLGIILFELLTGRVPYTAETPLAVVFKHIQDPLPPVRKYCPNLSTEMEMVLYKALAKKPEDRYQSAEDFVRALQQIEATDEIPALESAEAPETGPALPEVEPRAAEPVEQATALPPQPPTVEKMAPPAGIPINSGNAGGQFKTTPPPSQPPAAQTGSRPSYPPRTLPPSVAPKPASSWGVIAVLGVLVVCGLLGGVGLLGLGLLSSNGEETGRATATVNAEDFSAATAAAAQTETAAAEATAAAKIGPTATAAALQANATAVWKEATYTDPFKDNSGQWSTFSLNANSEYWVGVASIVDGVYQFKINQTKKPFIYWTAYKGETSNDFDLSVAARQLGGAPEQACYGLYFRNMGEKKYILNVCDNQTYLIEYYDGSQYKRLRDWTESPAIKPGQWNTLWVSARGETFTFYINEVKIETLKHNILPSGAAGLLFEVFNQDTPTFQFDNFAYIKR